MPHVFFRTFAKLILAQVFIEEIDMFDVAYVFLDTFAKLVLAPVFME